MIVLSVWALPLAKVVSRSGKPRPAESKSTMLLQNGLPIGCWEEFPEELTAEVQE